MQPQSQNERVLAETAKQAFQFAFGLKKCGIYPALPSAPVKGLQSTRRLLRYLAFADINGELPSDVRETFMAHLEENVYAALSSANCMLPVESRHLT